MSSWSTMDECQYSARHSQSSMFTSSKCSIDWFKDQSWQNALTSPSFTIESHTNKYIPTKLTNLNMIIKFKLFFNDVNFEQVIRALCWEVLSLILTSFA